MAEIETSVGDFYEDFQPPKPTRSAQSPHSNASNSIDKASIEQTEAAKEQDDKTEDPALK